MPTYGVIHSSAGKPTQSYTPSGGGAPAIGFDGSTGIYRPLLVTDWPQISWPVPSYRLQCQEPSGSLVDDVHGYTMAPSGTVEYNVAPAGGYASTGVGFTEVAAEGFFGATGTFWDVTTQPLVVYGEYDIRVAPGGGVNRALMAFTGATSMYIATFLSGAEARLQARGTGGNVNGTQNYLADNRFPILVEIFPGPGVLGYATARYRVSTNKEQINGTWALVTDATKGIATGSSGTQTASDCVCFDFIAWTGSEALNIGNTITPKVFLQSRGWTVTGY